MPPHLAVRFFSLSVINENGTVSVLNTFAENKYEFLFFFVPNNLERTYVFKFSFRFSGKVAIIELALHFYSLRTAAKRKLLRRYEYACIQTFRVIYLFLIGFNANGWIIIC